MSTRRTSPAKPWKTVAWFSRFASPRAKSRTPSSVLKFISRLHDPRSDFRHCSAGRSKAFREKLAPFPPLRRASGCRLSQGRGCATRCLRLAEESFGSGKEMARNGPDPRSRFRDRREVAQDVTLHEDHRRAAQGGFRIRLSGRIDWPGTVTSRHETAEHSLVPRRRESSRSRLKKIGSDTSRRSGTNPAASRSEIERLGADGMSFETLGRPIHSPSAQLVRREDRRREGGRVSPF